MNKKVFRTNSEFLDIGLYVATTYFTRMHCLNAFRIRLIIILLAMFIFWQIFRNWPGADDYSVRYEIL